MRLSVLVATLILLTSARAAADDAGELESKPTVLYAQVGLGTPLGYVGVEAARRLSPSFVLSAGAGMGLSGPQIALMPRLVLGRGRSALVVGAGISRGKYTSSNACSEYDGCAYRTGTANWANVEVGGEYRWPGGLSIRYFGGYGQAFADDLVCVGAQDQCAAYPGGGRSLAYTGLAVGQAF